MIRYIHIHVNMLTLEFIIDTESIDFSLKLVFNEVRVYTTNPPRVFNVETVVSTPLQCEIHLMRL